MDAHWRRCGHSVIRVVDRRHKRRREAHNFGAGRRSGRVTAADALGPWLHRRRYRWRQGSSAVDGAIQHPGRCKNCCRVRYPIRCLADTYVRRQRRPRHPRLRVLPARKARKRGGQSP